MHQQSLDHLFGDAFSKDFNRNSFSASQTLAVQNEEALKHEPLPDNLRVPTGQEVREFKNWEMQYRTSNPKASEREVRRAVIRNFNIVVIENQNMVKK